MSSQEQYDGQRGDKGLDGWWVTPQQAREYVVGHEAWWSHDQIQEQQHTNKLCVQQYDERGPPHRPIWMYANGDMYVGEWKFCTTKKRPVEHGFGATYAHNPKKYRGVVYVGGWKDGNYHGEGRAFWLESAPSWIRNKLGDTGVRQHDEQSGKRISRPYTYIGNYVDNVETDDKAVVSLKDGTARMGPWRDGKPVGDWWKDHISVAVASRSRLGAARGPTASSSSSSSSTEKIAGTKRKASPQEKEKQEQPAKKAKVTKRRSPVAHSEREKHCGRSSEAEDSSRVKRSAEANEETAGSHLAAPASAHEEKPVVVSNQDREGTITDWLCGVIGYDPDKEEMREYAKNFMALGLHSTQMISDLLPAQRVDSFNWMKEFHKLQFLSNANLKR